MPGTELLFSTTKIFPTDPKDQEKIPLWLKFFCYDYSDNSLIRVSTSSGIGPMLKCIMVPAPKEFINGTDVQYDTAIVNDKGNLINQTAADPTDGLIGMAIDSINGIANTVGVPSPLELPDIASTVTEALGIGAKIDMDMSDTKFKGVAKRIFNIKLIFIARNASDAELASEICEIFEAFALPQARLTPFSKFVCHPPLWRFGIGPGNGPNIDPAWSGQPQLSLLEKITVNRAGLKDSYGVADTAGKLKPIALTANMTFVELEPAMRSSLPQSSTIVNRSTAFWTGGGATTTIGNAVATGISRMV
jgi:hypothetical protein